MKAARASAALALLTGAGFLVEIFNQLTDVDPGYTQEGLLTFSLQVREDVPGWPRHGRP